MRSGITSTRRSGTARDRYGTGLELVMRRAAAFGTIVFALAAGAAAGGPIPGFGTAQDELAGDLRGLLLKNLPTPLYEAAPNWGHQSEVKRLHFRGRLREIQADIVHVPKNDGVWRRIRVDALNPA